MLDEVIKKQIDRDVLDFLQFAYFGNRSNPLVAAGNRAYLDMNRTIRFHGLSSFVRQELKEQIIATFDRELPVLTSSVVHSRTAFDNWHQQVCRQIRDIYIQQGIKFTYGQAQKWLNMTIKYLYMLEVCNFDQIFPYLHVPIDRYIFDVVQLELGIERPVEAWSRWDDYDQYLSYQKAIREKMTDFTPLRWEFRNWLRVIEG